MRRMALFGLVVLLSFAASRTTSEAATTGQNFSGSYGFGLQGNQFGPSVFVDLGVLTVHNDGSLSGTEFFDGAFAPFPSDAVYDPFPLTGTWSLNSDGVSGILDTSMGKYFFVMKDKGDSLILSRTDGSFENGHAFRQDPAFIATALSGNGKPTNINTVLCTGVNPHFPFSDFPSGAPISIIAADVTVKAVSCRPGLVPGTFSPSRSR